MCIRDRYILAGYSLGNIQDNILTELSNKYGFEFKFDKYNNFNLFGVKVVQTSHGSISGLGRIRGMTAFGAYINEASLANQEVFDEIKARCSGKGARIIADTNPDHPEHWLLKDYIKSGASGILSNHFSLDDNCLLYTSKWALVQTKDDEDYYRISELVMEQRHVPVEGAMEGKQL